MYDVSAATCIITCCLVTCYVSHITGCWQPVCTVDTCMIHLVTTADTENILYLNINKYMYWTPL